MRNLMFWMVATLVIFLFWSVSSRIQRNERRLSFSDFIAQLDRGHVEKVILIGTGAGTEIVGEFKNGQSIRTFAPPQMENLVNVMLDKGVEVTARDANRSTWLGHLISWIPIVIMVAFLIFFMRAVQSPRSGASRQMERRERRLEIKARFLHALSDAEGDLSEDEMMSALVEKGLVSPSDIEPRKALYEMLSDSTVVLTSDKKYRLRTAF